MLGHRSVEVNLFDAIGPAASLDDGQDFDVPVIIAGDGRPIVAQFAFGLQRVRRGVHHHVVATCDLQQAAQRAAQQGREIEAFFVWRQDFELVRMGLRHQPSLIGHAGRVGADGVVVADIIHNALGLPDLLPEDVAENAAVAIPIPFAG